MANDCDDLDCACRRGGAPMPTDRPDLAKLADAVEQAAQRFDLPSLNNSEFRTARRDVVEAAVAFVTARRATLAAGYVEVLVSREAVEALRRAMNTRASFGSGDDACRLLARDLDAVLKAG